MLNNNGLNRRDFFKVAATSGAATALVSCTPDKVETLASRLVPPDDMPLGTPFHFATTCKECSARCGVVVKTREGRALTSMGNDKDPITGGGICPVGQSSMQGLYNPMRIKAPMLGGNEASWEDALGAVASAAEKARAAGKQIYLVSEPESGSLSRLIDEFVTAVGGRRVNFDVTPDRSLKAAARKLFGTNAVPQFKIDEAKTLVNFGSDFLESWNNPVGNSRKFAKMHAYSGGEKNLFFHVSSHLNLTGSNADKWLSCLNGTEVYLAHFLIGELLPSSNLSESEKKSISQQIDARDLADVSQVTGIKKESISALLEAVRKSGALAITGGVGASNESSYALSYAVLLLNYILGNIGRSVILEASSSNNQTSATVKDLVQDLESGNVGLVIANNVNLVHALSGSGKMQGLLGKALASVTLSVSSNETTETSQIVLPSSHYLESWGDASVGGGIHRLQQPVMSRVPGFDSRQVGDIILQIAQKLGVQGENLSSPSFLDFLKAEWSNLHQKSRSNNAFDAFWKDSLQQGFHKATAPAVMSKLVNGALDSTGREKPSTVPSPEKLKLNVFNTTFHNVNSQTGDKYWLQEIPNPITQIVWDSWLEVNDDKAIELGINHGDEVKVTTAYGSATLGAYVYHGVSKDTVAMPAGYGRKLLFPSYSSRRGLITPFSTDNPKVLKNLVAGVNAADLLNTTSFNADGDIVFGGVEVTLEKTGNKASFVSVDGQYRDDKEALIADSKADFGDRGQKGRGVLKDTTPQRLAAGEPKEGHQLRDRHYTVDTRDIRDFYQTPQETVKESIFFKQPNYDPKYYDPYKFEMAVDLDKCTGCSSCVVACYAENNVPVVGKERIGLGREMSWIRIERFFDKTEDGETVTNIGPTMCQHCENAGCEPVCPVYATYHNPDGLNVQVYNRCVGTRYCANNCIYKQRRFNWRTFEFPFPLNMQLNPDVTVRTKGVMEKCTFCAQKIRHAKDLAKDEGRVVRDGEVMPACQGACPTNAISFGNAMDSGSEVSEKKKDLRSYHMFEEVNFRPSVTYLKKVRPSKTV